MSLVYRCDRCRDDCTSSRHWVEVSDVAVYDLCDRHWTEVAAIIAAAMAP